MPTSFVAAAGNPGGSDTNDPFGDGDGDRQSTIEVSKPSGTAEGDVMVGGMAGNLGMSVGSDRTPANWTSVVNRSLAQGVELNAAYRLVGASEPSSHTWDAGVSSDMEMCAATVTWTDAEQTPTITSARDDGAGSTPTAPSIAPGDGAGLFAFFAFDGGDGKPFGPSSTGYDERADMADGTGVFDAGAAAYTTIHGSGATGTKAFSASVSDGWNIVHIGVDPAADADETTEWIPPFSTPEFGAHEVVAY